MWHCPHCGAPQAETARCWVCRRSSTTCSTCSHFRRALAGDLGYCGLDARRRPLTGLEQRGCWEPNPAAVAETEQARVAMAVVPHRLRARRPAIPAARQDQPPGLRDFVLVESLIATPGAQAHAEPGEASMAIEAPADAPTAGAGPPPFVIEPDPDWAERTSLFGEPEG